ncbi:MAG: alpha/beta fold hydrolase [Gammaproteobacteria bacterium]|nr:alpha/beta fold hydrolase [Gammaproteobacteria bacterium]
MTRAVLTLAAVVFATSCGAGSEARSCEELQRRPVLMVHGSGLSSGSWSALTAELQRRGYSRTQLAAIDLDPNDGDNVRAAVEQIAPQADALLEAARAAAKQGQCVAPSRIDIVSHSMGAVSSRWFAARLAPHKVHLWIALAPANHGTGCAVRTFGLRQPPDVPRLCRRGRAVRAQRFGAAAAR